MSTTTLNFTIIYTTITCCYKECGLSFAVPEEWKKLRQEDHAWFYCPAGHKQHFGGETAQEKRIRELEEREKSLRAENFWLQKDVGIEREARQQVQRKLSATKGVLTRTKNRIAKGVCPCCNRTFAHLARHMATKHPEYEQTEP